MPNNFRIIDDSVCNKKESINGHICDPISYSLLRLASIDYYARKKLNVTITMTNLNSKKENTLNMMKEWNYD